METVEQYKNRRFEEADKIWKAERERSVGRLAFAVCELSHREQMSDGDILAIVSATLSELHRGN